MILRVIDFAKAADIGPVLVAAGDQEIVDSVQAEGIDAVLTAPDLPSGTDRTEAALQTFDASKKYDVVVNLQGDAPGRDTAPLRKTLAALSANPETDIATLVTPVPREAIANNPHAVKAVLANVSAAQYARALYFTRAAAPHGNGSLYKHAGLYIYRRDVLARLCALEPSPLERRENLEQLRALEAGMIITAAICDTAPPSIDTPEDLAVVEKLFQ